jgi:hypothetical protein
MAMQNDAVGHDTWWTEICSGWNVHESPDIIAAKGVALGPLWYPVAMQKVVVGHDTEVRLPLGRLVADATMCQRPSVRVSMTAVGPTGVRPKFWVPTATQLASG